MINDLAPVYCDITELVGNPIRTGIQRVAREVVRHWPGPRPLRLCRFEESSGGLVVLPDRVTEVLLELREEYRTATYDQLRQRIGDIIAAHMPEQVPLDATLLIPEVFFDGARCRHYSWRLENRPNDIYLLLFDFIVWLHPEAIAVNQTKHFMWYLRLTQQVRHPGFISDATLCDWQQRIVRDPKRAGTVLSLGADGLGIAHLQFDPRKRDFVALGSIDGRKNQMSIVAAFRQLWDEGMDVTLTLVGRIFEAEQSVQQELAQLADDRRFRHIDGASDVVVARVMADARATIYASTVEGYGLPPVESLAAGIPCITGRHIPSVKGIDGGLELLENVTPDEIAAKVRLMADDRHAAAKWREAAALNMPTWRDFGRAVAEWVDGSREQDIAPARAGRLFGS